MENLRNFSTPLNGGGGVNIKAFSSGKGKKQPILSYRATKVSGKDRFSSNFGGEIKATNDKSKLEKKKSGLGSNDILSKALKSKKSLDALNEF